MENLTKKDVYVVVDTPKKANKLKKVLDMFGERYGDATFNLIEDRLGNEVFLNFNQWQVDCVGSIDTEKQSKVSIKELRNILSKEHLKEGDYVVCYNQFDKYIALVNSVDTKASLFEAKKWIRIVDGLRWNNKGCFDNFKRYATPEEIALLDPCGEVIKKHDKFAELKEAHKNGALIQIKGNSTGNWYDIYKPSWEEKNEYRIKPEEKPNVVWKESLIREAHNYEIATNSLVKLCHGLAKDAGWHDKHREVGTMLALIHSEVSEAMEGFRKDLNDDHLTHRKMAEVELADAVIRIFDLAGYQGFDLGGALVEKLVYNIQRADHKIENRQGENGKKF